MSQDITLLEEISEQDLCQVNGGTGFTFAAPDPVGVPVKTTDMSPGLTLFRLSS